ncbi:MAG TPA: metallophosphoesterase [Pseudosphingobacterium sp.]|nr:metallophosphoesterase [Pseudosphingobacterium sp.]
MNRFFFYIFLSLIGFFTQSKAQSSDLDGLKIAFLADIHLQDLYGSLSDSEYKGVLNPKNNNYTLLRTMDAQLHSTRIFNENYFAFLAALDDIAKRGIKYIALPGDYSDDGQAIHIRGLQRILQQYRQRYGMQFFITTGNHDPVGPYKLDAGKDDFLGEGGTRQAIFSKKDSYHTEHNLELPLVISQDLAEMGYLGIIDHLNEFGFLPNKNYLYWETPFSNYSPESYSYEQAIKEAAMKDRMYDVAPGFAVPDVSYLVEPVNGLWLLAIDGNVYIPQKNKKTNGEIKYAGASLGYNNVLTHKTHLVTWVNKIVKEAKAKGKVLISFSHYPMIDFNDDASPEIKEFMGQDKWQLARIPNERVAETFADIGLQVHVAGHMHINDTGVRTTKKGNTLVNIQTPSLAAYIPGYKVFTVRSNNKIEVETIEVNDVPRFDELFELYEMEYELLRKQKTKELWDKRILETKNYREFTTWHLKELVRLRFLPNDWPDGIKNVLLDISGEELAILSNIESDASFDSILKHKNDNFRQQWETAKSKVEKELIDKHLSLQDFNDCSGFNLIVDFYKLHSADVLALEDIGKERLDRYRYIFESFSRNRSINANKHLIQQQFSLFFAIFNKFLHGAPAGHFLIDLKSGAIEDLTVKH